jgi:hypothetical protein
MSVTSEAAMATSVPVPIAKPTSAWARVGGRELSQGVLDGSDSLADRVPHVRARQLTRAPYGGDVPDLRQAEPQSPGPGDEPQHREHVVAIHSVPGLGPGGAERMPLAS